MIVSLAPQPAGGNTVLHVSPSFSPSISGYILQGRTEGVLGVWKRLSPYQVGVVVTLQVQRDRCCALALESLPRRKKSISHSVDTWFWMAKPCKPGFCDWYRSCHLGQQIPELFHGSKIQRTWNTGAVITSVLKVLLSTSSICSLDQLCSSTVCNFCAQCSLLGPS